MKQLYIGKGDKLSERNEHLPDFDPLIGPEDPKAYLATPGLRNAVNVALALGQPLLVTGDPGTGKTRLAASIAWELELPFFEFHTQTRSIAADLFYHYDALRRFQDAQLEEEHPIEHYITCQALGLAILLAAEQSDERILGLLPREPPEIRAAREKGPTRSVVLIDEIDKAPRDLPNDVLNEVERMQFTVRETDWPPFQAPEAYRPILILSSNSEKNLPDAFLRRCVFYHIEFPGAEMLQKIVRRRFGEDGFEEKFLTAAIAGFEVIREQPLKKKPATAEFLAWISILWALGIDPSQHKKADQDKIRLSFSVLAKSRDDLAYLAGKAHELFGDA
jgi:MoxR-like ATPase